MATNQKYTPKQRQDYYNQKSKVGATYVDRITGETKPVSDFSRGVAHQKAQNILKARKKKALQSKSK